MVFAFHLFDCFRKGRVRCVLKLYPEVFSPSVVHCSFAINNVLDSISLYNIYGVNIPWGQHGKKRAGTVGMLNSFSSWSKTNRNILRMKL